MEPGRKSPSLVDLFTVLYRPRQTMRRLLDGGPDRWAVPIVLLAFVCASTNDPDLRHIRETIPSLALLPTLSVVALAILVNSLVWVAALYVFSWIAAIVGRMLGGNAPLGDIRAALAWGMVPTIWSVVYRIPVAIFVGRIPVGPNPNVWKIAADVISRGGCVVAVVVFALQLLFFLWSVYVASCCMGEAQRFSSWRGLANVVSAIALPLIVIGGLVFSLAR